MGKLLIVDNSAALLEIMKNILEFTGYTVKTLIRSDNIYKEINEFQPDLLILDTYLAGEDGREICKELRRSVESKHLGVLVFSAFPKTLENYRSYYADDFIEKPFDMQILLEKIKSLLYWTSIRNTADFH
jgi:DNA-binding response OmpR family regulator